MIFQDLTFTEDTFDIQCNRLVMINDSSTQIQLRYPKVKVKRALVLESNVAL